MHLSVGKSQRTCYKSINQSVSQTVHASRARRSIASWHYCCILQSLMPTFTEPKQQGADDMCCCIARLERE